jgi:hypothetical protein
VTTSTVTDLVTVVLARPTSQRPASALEREASSFVGWPLMEPEPDERRRARQGIPRPPSDLRGEVVEAWWDAGERAVVGRLSLTDRLAALLRRLPGAVRLVAKDGWIAVTSAGGRASGPAHPALTESYINTRKDEDMPEMTLGEALRRPEVVRFLRHELGLPEPERAVVPARLDDRTRGERLLESLAETPAPRRPAGGEVRDLFVRRGLDPKLFGLPGGDAA